MNAEENAKKPKGFMDSIHGFIELHPLLVKIIDTSQFQRLRNIKQLGGNYHVYPGASYNRFEHCIGTCYLAGKLIRHLKKELEQSKEEDKLSGVEITDIDVLCVEIAGLCHDLGHGPFSHVFDSKFMKKCKKQWKHEKGSCDLLEHLIKSNVELKEMLCKQINLNDLTFIKKMIHNETQENNFGTYRDQPFFYEIIANEKSGVDVDKWDGLLRDCHHLGMKCTFDHNRFISLTRLVEWNDKVRIAVRDKECKNLYELFHVRDSLYKKVYKHKVTTAVEEMISDALFEANDLIVPKISDKVDNMDAYEKLNDCVLDTIRHSADKNMKDAQEIVKRIDKRDLYQYVCNLHYKNKAMAIDFQNTFEKIFSKTTDQETFKTLEENKEKLFSLCKNPMDGDVGANNSSDVLRNIETQCKRALNKVYKKKNCTTLLEKMISQREKLQDKMFCVINKFDYGCEGSNPVEKYLFYDKKNPDKAFTLAAEEVSFMLPERYEEYEVVIYSKLNKDDPIYKAIVQDKQDEGTSAKKKKV